MEMVDFWLEGAGFKIVGYIARMVDRLRPGNVRAFLA
jgi:hypothetical protein